MLEIFRSFFTAYWYVIIPVVFTVLLSIPVIVYWSSFKYWLMKVRIRLPGLRPHQPLGQTSRRKGKAKRYQHQAHRFSFIRAGAVLVLR